MSLMAPDCPRRDVLEHQVRKGLEREGFPSPQGPVASDFLPVDLIPNMALANTRTATARKSRAVFQQDP